MKIKCMKFSYFKNFTQHLVLAFIINVKDVTLFYIIYQSSLSAPADLNNLISIKIQSGILEEISFNFYV